MTKPKIPRCANCNDPIVKTWRWLHLHKFSVTSSTNQAVPMADKTIICLANHSDVRCNCRNPQPKQMKKSKPKKRGHKKR